MADLVIRGMAMPENCTECPCFSQWDDCGINHEWKFADEFDKTKDRLPSCPLLPLPEGHGELIDKAEAYDRIAEQEGGNYIDMDSVGKGLEECQIVVPAEGGNADG